MDNFETTYDVEDNYIQCTVCDKSIRGETLYKIHLTSPGHLKKEEASVASGNPGRKSTVPEFKDILHYLDYLKLNEPIIGLDELCEVPSQDAQAASTYSCKLCNVTSNMMEIVHHLIGRKHRQKYVERKRPDLVTWDSEVVFNQMATVIRAKAEIIERQDGRGNPVLLPKQHPQNKSNSSRDPPSQRPNRKQHNPKTFPPNNIPPFFPEDRGYVDKYSDQGRYPPRNRRSPPNMDGGRQRYQQEDRYVEDEQYSAANNYRPEYESNDNIVVYEEDYVENPQRRDQPYDQIHRRPQSQRDARREFYSEEVRQRETGSPYESSSSPPPHRQNERQWSLDREPCRYDGSGRASRSGSNASEAQWGSAPTDMEDNQTRSHLLKIIKDYQHEKREALEEEVMSYSGPSRRGPAPSQRLGDVTKTMAAIPEPFRRFLTGATNEEEFGRRKRKSRFSDATVEEVERTKRMFRDEYEPPQHSGHPRADPWRPESRETEHFDLYTQSQSPQHPESYQRESVGSDGVFDLLNGIEIDNTEEANFLKNKLCGLLREFKTKKEQAKKNQVGEVKSVNHQPSPLRQQYESTFSPDSDLRRPLDTSYKGDFRGRGWEQKEYTPEEQPQDYHHSVGREPGPSNRSHYEETMRRPGMSRAHQQGPFADEPEYYSDKFHEPLHSRDYRSPAQEYFDSTPRPGIIDEESKAQNSFRYSKNLDKITSTLLEFVARKQ